MCPHRPVCTVHQQRQLLPGVPRQRHHRGGAGLRHRELGEGPLRRPSFLPGVLWGAGTRFPWLSSAAVTAGPLVGPPAERVLEEGRRPHFLDEVLRLPPGLEQPLLGPGKPGAQAMLTGACLSDSSQPHGQRQHHAVSLRAVTGHWFTLPESCEHDPGSRQPFSSAGLRRQWNQARHCLREGKPAEPGGAGSEFAAGFSARSHGRVCGCVSTWTSSQSSGRGDGPPVGLRGVLPGRGSRLTVGLRECSWQETETRAEETRAQCTWSRHRHRLRGRLRRW